MGENEIRNLSYSNAVIDEWMKAGCNVFYELSALDIT